MKKRLLAFFDTVREFLIGIFTSRLLILAFILILFFVVIAGRLFYLQIVKADYYADNFTLQSQRTVTTAGARGNIYDCNGKLLAYNEISYSVVMTDLIESSDEKGNIINGIIYETIKLIEMNGDHILEDFNITTDSAGNYVFKDEPVTPQITFLCNVFGLSSAEIYSEGYDRWTAAEIIEHMASEDRFDISSEYGNEYVCKIAAVRYALSLNAYQKYVSAEIASEISNETRAAIMENSSVLTGVEVEEKYNRVYVYGEYASAVLGYTGEISVSELEEYNNSDTGGILYESGDIVGKAGVEKSFDTYLQGTKGTDTFFVDSTGNILSVVDSTDSARGNDLYLSIDIDLTIAGYEMLEHQLASILVSKIVEYDYVYDEEDTVVLIPVKDVYYKLLTNVIDIDRFSDSDASEREKQTLSNFLVRREEVIENIEAELTAANPKVVGKLTAEYNDYMYLIYDMLGDLGILDKSIMDTSNATYRLWANENASLKDFLMEAISENWINVDYLNVEEDYIYSDDIYDVIVDRVIKELPNNEEFINDVYYYMIYDESISGYDICMMLYDQEKIETDQKTYENLKESVISPYNFVISEIADLTITPAMVALDPCSGSIVLTDTKTGQVKALITYPSYDNNKMSGHIDADYWEELNTDDSLPLYNRATQALTAPGSTFKMVTAVAGLENGIIDTDTEIYDLGEFTEVSPSPTCWAYPGSHGYVNVSSALEFSCNYYFYTLGYELGMDSGTYDSATALSKIEEYAIKLGLAMLSGVETEETSPQFSTTDSVRTAIGQAKNAYSTVQLARYITTVANSGLNRALTLIDHVENREGTVVYTSSPEITNTVDLTTEEWNAIHEGLRLVTTNGTASSVFAGSAALIAGKTGTTQEILKKSNHALFVGYSPYDNPEISVACIIRNGDAASYAAQAANDIINYYYGYISLEDLIARELTESVVLE